jgi:hypothetical protein
MMSFLAIELNFILEYFYFFIYLLTEYFDIFYSVGSVQYSVKKYYSDLKKESIRAFVDSFFIFDKRLKCLWVDFKSLCVVHHMPPKLVHKELKNKGAFKDRTTDPATKKPVRYLSGVAIKKNSEG